jgi:hypothetical protein
MVRAVYLRMAIETPARQNKLTRRPAARKSLRRGRNGRMALGLMALLAEKRNPRLQKSGLSRAVRLVAVSTVLSDRLMLP